MQETKNVADGSGQGNEIIDRGRLTTVETVTYQTPGEEPLSVAIGTSEIVSSDDQPFVRRMKVGSEGVTYLGECWIKEASTIVIENLEGKHQVTYPTKEYLKQLERSIIFVGRHTNGSFVHFAAIKPGGSLRIPPSDHIGIYGLIVAEKPLTAKCRVTVFPK